MVFTKVLTTGQLLICSVSAKLLPHMPSDYAVCDIAIYF